MTLYFEEEGDVKLPLECEALAKRVVEANMSKARRINRIDLVMIMR